MTTFVIAEAAATHDGNLVKACQLIDLAAAIGADAVKFQWLSSAERLCERRRAPEYLASYRLLEFPVWWFQELADVCEKHQIEFMCTAYLPEDLVHVAQWVKRFKVASFEAGDREFVDAHRKYGKPIIVSSGMGGPHYDLDNLHCISAYPAPTDQMNLRRISRGGYVGLSDHSLHPWVGALAVAAGARIVEFHVRLWDTSPDNADYRVARNPDEAIAYVQNIRLAELAMGKGDREAQECEKPMMRYRV